MPSQSPFATIASRGLALTVALALAGCSMFRDERPATPAAAAPQPESKAEATAEKAADIAAQPARDLGMAKPEIPAPLVRATDDPYSMLSTGSCTELAAAITELNEHLGPDYMLAGQKEENAAGKIAEAGGKTIVNSIIPFRGLVRELTGAAEAQRRYADAVDAGYARRGFLRGLQMAKACSPQS